MRKNGRIIYCDRCKKAVFLEENTDDKVPESWEFIDGMDLCGGCSRIYKVMKRTFLDSTCSEKVHF
jgi:hypothetical protein